MTILVAAVVMVSVTMMQHLGLTEAVGKVLLKVLRCNMCCSFWGTLVVMLLMGSQAWLAALLAITAAYASNWLVLLLAFLEKLYHKLWQRIQEKK